MKSDSSEIEFFLTDKVQMRGLYEVFNFEKNAACGYEKLVL